MRKNALRVPTDHYQEDMMDNGQGSPELLSGFPIEL